MTRIVRIGAAQSGPVQKSDGRQEVLARLMELMKQGKVAGRDLVVFTELALATFFPRYYAMERAEMNVWFEIEMPGPATRP